MSNEPRSVQAVDRLDTAAWALWENDCGLVPVVDGEGAVVGVVTDRDICMAAYTQGRSLGEISVASVMARGVATCRADEPVSDVMVRMQDLAVHRLPVVDSRDILVGVISTNDLVRAAHARPAAVDPTAVVRTLAAIGAPRSAMTGPEVEVPVAELAPAQPVKRAVTRKKAAPRKATGAKKTAKKTKTVRQAAKPATSGAANAKKAKKAAKTTRTTRARKRI